MRRHYLGWFFVAATGFLTGCVERRYVIYTDPPGAIVSVNGRTVGAAPVDQPIRHYGGHRIKMDLDGHETLTVDEPIRAPWYEYFPLDFFAENIWSGTIRDVRTYTYQLKPTRVVPPEPLLERAGQLRNRGQEIGNVTPGSLPGPELPMPHIPRSSPP